jgi:hypothetical protein
MGSQNGKQLTHHNSSIKKKIKSKDTLNSSFGTTSFDDRISAGNNTLGKKNFRKILKKIKIFFSPRILKKHFKSNCIPNQRF